MDLNGRCGLDLIEGKKFVNLLVSRQHISHISEYPVQILITDSVNNAFFLDSLGGCDCHDLNYIPTLKTS